MPYLPPTCALFSLCARTTRTLTSGANGIQATGVDAVARSGMRQHLVVTQLLRDIPVSSGLENIDFTPAASDIPHAILRTDRTERTSTSSRVSWGVSRTAAVGAGYGTLAHHDPESLLPPDAFSWWSPAGWGGGEQRTSTGAPDVLDRVVAWNDKGDRVSLYMKGAPATSRSSAGVSTRSGYSGRGRTADEVYNEEIEPQVARRQWVAVGSIGLLLVFIWLWAMNGGPLAALWAHN